MGYCEYENISIDEDIKRYKPLIFDSISYKFLYRISVIACNEILCSMPMTPINITTDIAIPSTSIRRASVLNAVEWDNTWVSGAH